MNKIEREAFLRLLRAGGFHSMLDVGANVGLYGFLFHAATQGEVIMIEADPENARLARKTIKRSGLAVQLREVAVCDHSGTVRFHQDTISGATGSVVRGGADSFLATHGHGAPKSITVPAITLDDLGADADLLKIDVEGSELSVFRGAAELLKRRHPAVLFECDSDQCEIEGLLAGYGYRLFGWPYLAPGLAHDTLALYGDAQGIVQSLREALADSDLSQ